MFSPFVPASVFRDLSEDFRQKGDFKRATEYLEQAQALEGHAKMIMKQYRERDQIIANAKLKEKQWKICIILTIVSIIATSAILFSLEYYGFLYHR